MVNIGIKAVCWKLSIHCGRLTFIQSQSIENEGLMDLFPWEENAIMAVCPLGFFINGMLVMIAYRLATTYSPTARLAGE